MTQVVLHGALAILEAVLNVAVSESITESITLSYTTDAAQVGIETITLSENTAQEFEIARELLLESLNNVIAEIQLSSLVMSEISTDGFIAGNSATPGGNPTSNPIAGTVTVPPATQWTTISTSINTTWTIIS